MKKRKGETDGCGAAAAGRAEPQWRPEPFSHRCEARPALPSLVAKAPAPVSYWAPAGVSELKLPHGREQQNLQHRSPGQAWGAAGASAAPGGGPFAVLLGVAREVGKQEGTKGPVHRAPFLRRG